MMKNMKRYKSITENDDCEQKIHTKKPNVEMDASLNIKTKQKVLNCQDLDQQIKVKQLE